MTTTSRAAVLSLIASTLTLSLPAYAHHSFPAEYDASKPVMLTGKVTKVEWTNPHIFIYIDVADAKTGAVANWALELGGPNSLLRLGWKRDSLKAGDVVIVEGSLARTVPNLANAKTIVMAETGKRMLAGSSGPATSEGQR
ncbi:MAG TPA: DUF6152 family protein [Gammaproteobacteria bacterium]|nr:DUF6152 family protein [Gammaproteobacteria bacterium]